MIIVTLIVTIAAGMVWQQWRAVQVEAAERARVQSAWILSGALDWARLILREDARSGRVTSLGEPWSVPLAEARLSTFLAADLSNADDSPEAFLSGSITDAQSRYNLRNLLEGSNVEKLAEQAVLERLLDSLGLAADVASRITNGLRDAQAGGEPAVGAAPTSALPLKPQSIAQLSWLGIDAPTIERLREYVVLLPTRTPVNLNTAPREVLAAVIDGLDLASAERLVQARQRTAFGSRGEAKLLLPGPIELKEARVDVRSTYFEVRGRLRLDDWTLEESSLLRRKGLEHEPVQRERVNRQDSLRQGVTVDR